MPDAALLQRLRNALRRGGQIAAGPHTFHHTADAGSVQRLQNAVIEQGAAVVRSVEKATLAVLEPSAAFTSDARTVGLWHFNDALTDASNNGNDGTIAGTYSYGTGKFGKCLVLTDARVTIPDAASLDVGRYFCIQAWVKTSAAGTIAERDTWRLFIDGSMNLNLSVGADTLTSEATITADTWTYVMAQFGAGEMWVAVDDVVKRQTTSISSVTDAAVPLYLGNNSDDNDPLVGSIDEVILHSQRRFVSDYRRSRVRAAPGDLFVFNFEEGVGTTAYNARLGGADMTLSGTTWSSSGRTGNCLVFDGSTSYGIVTPTATTLDTISLGGWFKFSSASGSQVLFDQASGIGLQFTGSALRAPLTGVTNPDTDLCSWTPTADQWYEIYAVYDGTTKQIWIDGQKWGEVACTGSPVVTGTCYVGCSSGSADYFEGSMDDLVLSDAVRKPYYRATPHLMIGQHGLVFTEDWML